MADLVYLLRHMPPNYGDKSSTQVLRNEAADEIDRLRAALTVAREEICWWASEHGCCIGHEDHALTVIDEALAATKTGT
jgi:hypothetical protein